MGFDDVSSWHDALLGRERAGNGVVPFQLTEKGYNISGWVRGNGISWEIGRSHGLDIGMSPFVDRLVQAGQTGGPGRQVRLRRRP